MIVVSVCLPSDALAQCLFSDTHLYSEGIWEYITVMVPGGSDSKESACNVGDLGSIPRLERSSREGKSYPLQYSGPEKSMDCIVHGVAKSWTQLSDFHFHECLE